MQHLDLAADGFFEPSRELGQRAAGARTQNDVEGLPVGPVQLVTDERFEYLEELLITDQQAAFILEGRGGHGQLVGASSRASGATRGLRRRIRRIRRSRGVHRQM
jgi:hypothetical protein